MPSMETANEPKKPTQLEEKWGKEVLEVGFVLVPTLLLKKQKEFGLESTEVVVLLNLLASWWEPEKLPFPRTTTIAQRMHVTTRTVQRCLKSLEDKGFITKHRVSTGTPDQIRLKTSYDISGTVLRLTQARHGAELGLQKQKTRRKAGSVGQMREGLIAVTPNPEILVVGGREKE